MKERYQRHIQLAAIGEAGQTKLAAARVLVVGAGGLGCPILQYLTACGVGRIGIVDFDTVSLSNLHRQILYTEADVGKNKAQCAARRLSSMNSETRINVYPYGLTAENALDVVREYDLVVDGTDNFVTRYLLNDAVVLLDKPLVFGALYKFEGQVSVFNYENGPTYRCLFPDPPAKNDVPNCNDIGVLGVLPGIIGLLQALEVIKIITGTGEVLSGRVLHYDTLTHRQRIFKLKRNDVEIQRVLAWGKPQRVVTDDCTIVNTLSLSELDRAGKDIFVDVRERHETPRLSLPNLVELPLSEMARGNVPEGLLRHQRKVVFCQSGVRSRRAVGLLSAFGVPNCFALRDGAVALGRWWNRE